MRRRIVSLNGTDRHLVIGTSYKPKHGKMLDLLSLDGTGSHQSVLRSDATQVIDMTEGGKGSVLRAILANRRAQEQGGGGLSLRCNSLFKPFQFRPLVKFQGEADRRILIADETGLGKTIETGYILVEEYAAGRANRILIMAPARSVGKWRDEMRSRFGIILEEASAKKILEYVNNPARNFHLICSHDVGSTGWWEELAGSLDILVIDEIHNHIGTGQKFRRPMAEALSDCSDAMIGLTATPVRKSSGDLFRILELITPGISHNLDQATEIQLLALTNSLTRALEEEDQNNSKRICDELEALLPAVADHPLHPRTMISKNPPWEPEAVAESVRHLRGLPKVSKHITRARGRDPDIDEYTPRIVHPTHWIEPQGDDAKAIAQIDDLLHREFYHIHRQQLASCRPAMLPLMMNGFEGLRSFQREAAGAVPVPIEEPSGPVEKECEEMVRLLRRIRLSEDAKFEELSKLMEALRADQSVTKAVVFTHFRPTFRYLKKRMEQEVMVKEGVRLFFADPTDKDEKLQSLNDRLMETDGFAILLATDRMSEAVDLHAANCVVNYDLPYNPQDLQQRIGRVDRIVQEADEIHVHNFAVRGTVDEAIMTRIIERSKIFQAVVGGMEDVAKEMAVAFNARREVGEALGSLENHIDKRNLIEAGDEFRLVDRVFDDQIRSARIRHSPFLSREHVAVLEAFKRLSPGTNHSWYPEERILVLAVDRHLAKAIHDMLTPHKLGPKMVRELMVAAKTGKLTLRFDPGQATVGPAHEFNRWVTEMLSALEGCEEPVLETSSQGLHGSISLVQIRGTMISDSIWIPEPSESTMGEWLDEIERNESATRITPLSQTVQNPSLNTPEIQAMISRDRAEHDRLKQARIRRLHAIRRRLEDEEDNPRTAMRLNGIIEELDYLDKAADPDPAIVTTLHEYRTNTAQ